MQLGAKVPACQESLGLMGSTTSNQRWKQEDWKIKAILSCVGSLSLVWATRDPVSKGVGYCKSYLSPKQPGAIPHDLGLLPNRDQPR